MSIRIEIIDPTIKDEKMLVATARFLMEIAGHQMVPAPVEVKPPIAAVEDLVEFSNPETGEMEKITKVELMEKIVKHEENRSERTMALLDICLEDKPKAKRKKKVNPLVQEIAESHEKIMMEVVNEVTVPIAPPYAHCAVPIDPPPIDPPKMGFNSLIAKITKLTDEKKLENADVLRIVRTHGLDKTHYLSTNPHLIEAVSVDIDKFVEGK